MVQVPIKSTSTTQTIPNSHALEAWLNDLANQIIEGKRLNRAEALRLTEISGEADILKLCAAADRIKPWLNMPDLPE